MLLRSATMIALVACCFASLPGASIVAQQALADARPLSESQGDRIRHEAWYATAETLHHQGDLKGALQAYQRAWRWAPSSGPLLRKIVSLAASLDRIDLAIRYASLDTEFEDDPDQLRRLALYATQQRDWARAVRLHERWLATPHASLSRNRFERLLIRIELGRIYAITDQAERASATFRQVHQAMMSEETSARARRLRAALGGSLRAIWRLIGANHFEAGQLNLAQEAFAQLESDPETRQEAQFGLARIAWSRGDPLEAYERLRRYYEFPDEPLGDAPYALLKKVLVQLHDHEGLASDLKRLHEMRPHSSYASLALAKHWEASGDLSRARTLYADLFQRATTSSSDPAVDEFVLAEVASWLIKNRDDADQPDELLSLLRRLANRSKTLAIVEEPLREVMSQQSLEDAVFAKLQPSESEEITIRDATFTARLAMLSNRYNDAARYYRTAISQSEENGGSLAYEWGLRLIFAEAYSEATDAFRWSIAHKAFEEEDPAPYFYYSAALALEDEFDLALQAARAASERDPESAEFASRVAWVLTLAKRKEEARKAYESLIDRFEEDSDPATQETLKEARLALSFLATQLDDDETAVEWLQQALDEFPEDPGAKNDLAYLWAERGEHLQRARIMIHEALEAEPENSAYWDTLGWIEYRREEWTSALRAVDKAIDLASGHPGEQLRELLDHQGDILHALGKGQQAIEAWTRSLKLYEEENDRAESVRAKLRSISGQNAPTSDAAPRKPSASDGNSRGAEPR